MGKKKKTEALDLSEAVEGGKGPKERVEPGTYRALVSSSVLDTSKRSGNPMLVLEFSIIGDTRYAGFKLKRYCVLKGKGAGMTKDVLLAFHEDDELTDGFEVDPSNYLGEKAIITVEEDWYKHPEYTNEHHPEGKFPSRKIVDVFSIDDEDAGNDADKTEEETADEDEGDEDF